MEAACLNRVLWQVETASASRKQKGRARKAGGRMVSAQSNLSGLEMVTEAADDNLNI